MIDFTYGSLRQKFLKSKCPGYTAAWVVWEQISGVSASLISGNIYQTYLLIFFDSVIIFFRHVCQVN